MGEGEKIEPVKKLTQEELERAADFFGLLLKWQKEYENEQKRTENCTEK